MYRCFNKRMMLSLASNPSCLLLNDELTCIEHHDIAVLAANTFFAY